MYIIFHPSYIIFKYAIFHFYMFHTLVCQWKRASLSLLRHSSPRKKLLRLKKTKNFSLLFPYFYRVLKNLGNNEWCGLKLCSPEQQAVHPPQSRVLLAVCGCPALVQGPVWLRLGLCRWSPVVPDWRCQWTRSSKPAWWQQLKSPPGNTAWWTATIWTLFPRWRGIQAQQLL